MEKEKPQKETLYTLRGRRDNHSIYRLLQSGVGGVEMAKFKHTERTAKIYNSIIKEYREINSDSDLEAIGIDYDD